MNKKKVLFFLSPGVGGAQRVSVLFSKLLDASQYEVVYAIVGEAKSSIMDFLPLGAVVKQIKIRNIYDFTTFKIMALLRREKPYAVFCSQMYLNIRVIWAANWLGGIKVVIRSNSMVQNLRSKRLDFVVATMLYRTADRVVAQTKEMRDEMISVFNVDACKTIVINNPLDKQQIENKINQPSPYSSNNETRFICVGRIAEVKGCEVAIKALQETSKSIENAHLYFVGEFERTSGYFYQLEQLIKQIGLEKRVHFVGYTDNPYIWVKYADVFILSSHIEGLPNALIEALYLHKPAVATRCIPIVEQIIQEGINGYLVNCGDDEGMATSMIKAVALHSVNSMSFEGATAEEINKLFKFDV